jgi:hypothetical protein
MYNLTVDEVHTFAVGDGDWVVHNDLVEYELDTVTYTQSHYDMYDGLTGHHMPSVAFMERWLGDSYSKFSAFTLLLPNSVHSTLSTTKKRYSAQGYGSMNPYEALQRDINDVREAYRAEGRLDATVESKLSDFESMVLSDFENTDLFDPENGKDCN